MTTTSRGRRVLAAFAATSAVAAGIVGFTAPAAQAAPCSDVELIFARGSGELQGPSILQGGVLNSLKGGLPGKSVTQYSVRYAADIAQTSAGQGSTDLTNHLVAQAAACPNQKFVLGGYSQGATVVDKSVGLPAGSFVGGGAGKVIPANLAPRVSAVVAFGNPAAIVGGKLTQSKTYGSKAKEFCAAGDPVCAAGVNFVAHLSYVYNGNTGQAGKFAAQKVLGG